MDADDAPRRAEKLLIVDDDEPLLALLGRMLERHGYCTVMANDAKEALTAYREQCGSIDAVITDLVMSGTDGRSFARDLLGLDPDVKILVSTGMSNSRDMSELLDMGVKGFVFKPYNSRDLIAKIQETLEG